MEPGESPHIHYEVLADGQNIDPFYVLKNK